MFVLIVTVLATSLIDEVKDDAMFDSMFAADRGSKPKRASVAKRLLSIDMFFFPMQIVQ